MLLTSDLELKIVNDSLYYDLCADFCIRRVNDFFEASLALDGFLPVHAAIVTADNLYLSNGVSHCFNSKLILTLSYISFWNLVLIVHAVGSRLVHGI